MGIGTGRSGGGMSLGGLAVRNDVRTDTNALASDANLVSGSDFSLVAQDTATIEASASGNVTSTPDESASNPAVPDTSAATPEKSSAGLAINAAIVTNLILNGASALISDSRIEAISNVDVAADSLAAITAINEMVVQLPAAAGDGAAVGVTLAFNTIGWEAQNLFANTIDTYLL